MRLPDVNVLLYAADRNSPHHDRTAPYVESMIGGRETVALAWVVALGFIRLATKPQLMLSPLTVARALDVVDGWLDRPNVVVVHPTDRHAAVLRELLVPLGTGVGRVQDAHLAALAIEHGAELVSADRDFARFSGLRWHDPLH